MDVQPLIFHSDERSLSPDTRWQVAQCLHRAFAVGDGGSFTSLLRAIENEPGMARRESTSS